MMARARLAAAALMLVPVAFGGGLAARAASGHSVTVIVTNVRNNAGHVHVDVCPQGLFLKDNCPYMADAPAHAGTTRVVVNGVPAGDYGIQATHDENDNHKVDRNFLGMPKEGIGFSRDAPIHLSPPSWKDAVISVRGDASFSLRMRYMLGKSGPDQR